MARRALDGAQYVRVQRGHSIVLHLLIGCFVCWINVIYITLSPNHYLHLKRLSAGGRGLTKDG